jgi:long-chain acyl-CoA synthetase
VVGDYDAVKGEEVHAFVQLKPDTTLTTAQLLRHCRERLADYKCPRKVTVLAELPVSSTGKVLKRTLKEGAKGHPVQ